jgi:hypothetical protein
MMVVKVILRILVFALVLTMLENNQARGEKDCYHEKLSIKQKCKKSIKLDGSYVRPMPGDTCCKEVTASDMVCVCRVLTPGDFFEISSIRLVNVARECGNPLPVGFKCGSKWLIL